MDMKIFNYNISPISNYELNKNNKTNKVQNNYSDGRFMLNSLSFLGDINRPLIKKSIDIPIKDDEEFNEVMNRVYSAKTLGGNELWIPEDYKNVFITYRNASDIEMGLIPYCGESDNSYLINVYLSGRLEDSDIKRIQGHHFPQNIDSCVDVAYIGNNEILIPCRHFPCIFRHKKPPHSVCNSGIYYSNVIRENIL